MDTTKTPDQNVPGKKEIRKELADKIAAAIPELKTTLGDKKFEHRIKKAVKLITDGMHKKERITVAKKAKAKTSAPKKVVVKKSAKSVKKAD